MGRSIRCSAKFKIDEVPDQVLGEVDDLASSVAKCAPHEHGCTAASYCPSDGKSRAGPALP